ncbi:MAG: ATP-binding cassette domain-containing protein [Betaproteobacteria bacterium]|nr:ATP-binding cassette domain-containing protein [Betaproteobacteria bacterium]
MAPSLKLDGIGKDYARLLKRSSRARLLYDLLRGKPATDYFRALNDVSFVLEPGGSLGLIGENGAGKSTLLKIIAGVIPPTRGRIVVNGRISALLELGSGFHPEYSGIENIHLAGSLAGLSEKQIRAKREEIIEFADIGEHISQPIKTYSSGMIVRLGFAVATAIRPEILITDEVLAVGDESFQKKCIAWQEDYLKEGGTLLLCSHSTYHVQKLCRQALWMHHGAMERYGPASDVVTDYLAYHEEKTLLERKRHAQHAQGNSGLYSVTQLELSSEGAHQGTTLHRHELGRDLMVRGQLHSPDGRPPGISIGIVRTDGTPVYGVIGEAENYQPLRMGANRYDFNIRFPNLPLLPGRYTVRAHAMDPEGMRLFDTVERELLVAGTAEESGLCSLKHEWVNADAASTDLET